MKIQSSIILVVVKSPPPRHAVHQSHVLLFGLSWRRPVCRHSILGHNELVLLGHAGLVVAGCCRIMLW